MNLGEIASSLLTEAAKAKDTTTPEQKADLTEVVKAVRGIQLPDMETLSMLKGQLEGLSKEKGLPLSVQGAMTLLLQNFGTLDATSQESGQKVWDKIKPFLSDKDKLAAMVSTFGTYSGQLLDILKNAFLRGEQNHDA